MGRTKNRRHKMGKAHVPSVVRYHQTSSRIYSQEHVVDVVVKSVLVDVDDGGLESTETSTSMSL